MTGKALKRALIITDAWSPQTNGVVTTLESVIRLLPEQGFEVDVIHPGLFSTMALPSYPEIRIARDPWRMGAMIEALRPDTIHIATEGPLGLWARQWLGRRLVPYTTSLHTKFPEYIAERTGLPVGLGYRFLRWFHRPALHTLCTTESHRRELEQWGLRDLVVWGRGVDTDLFRPRARRPRRWPRLLYVGRVALEKNLEAFLRLDVPGDKFVVGDGPARATLEARFPDATWLGYLHGEALAVEYADADVFVFPSLTDTFGLVMLEALASGTPVAAYPVTGPLDIVLHGVTGMLSDDLGAAVRGALELDRAACRTYAQTQNWSCIAARMARHFVAIDWRDRPPARHGFGLSRGAT
ncbi:MAG: glycosyltransferase family 1 protein [Pseudomonadales bacterium]|nr:glycosyltransferase family 1 protein [Pseudomonadales bacterium]